MGNIWGEIAEKVENYAVLAEQVGDHDLAEDYRTAEEATARKVVGKCTLFCGSPDCPAACPNR